MRNLKAPHLHYALYGLLCPPVADQEDSGDSGSEMEVKKGRRHRLLRHKLSLSEGESGDEKSDAKEKNKEAKKRARRKGC